VHLVRSDANLPDPSGGAPAGAVPEEVTLTEAAIARGEELSWEQLVDEARRRGPDPRFRELDDAQLVERICRDASAMTAAMCRWLELIGELVVRGVWADEGARTPGKWLSWKLGIGAATGREHVRVALRLRDLPAVRERFAAGTLSYSKVRAITRIAVPDAEELLVMWADHATAAQMETIVRGLRGSQRARDTEPGEPDDPRYREAVRVHADGTATLTIRGPAEDIVAVSDGLRLLAEALVADRLDGGTTDPQDPPSPNELEQGGTATELSLEDTAPRRTSAADRVEALGHVVAAAVAADVPPDTSGLDRTTLVLHVDAAELAVEPTDGPDVVPVQDAHGRIRAMDRRVLRRLACGAGRVTAAIGDSGEPLDLGRRRRDTSAALRRAVHLRDRSCTYPGCGATRHLDAHHVRCWSDGGPTSLTNLVLLCSHHHRFVHRHDVVIEVRPDGRHRFTLPRHRTALPAVGRLPGASAGTHRHAAPDGATTALAPPGPIPTGRFDLDTAVAILLQTYERAHDGAPVAA
jgi:hypothetical protein